VKGKQAKLTKALTDALSNPSGDNLYELLKTSYSVMKPADGLIWDEVVDVLETVTHEELDHLKSVKCPECKSSLNINKECVSMSCPEGRKTRDKWSKGGKR
jgi:hypothetical protein